MKIKTIAGAVILVMLLGGLGGVVLDRMVFPYLSTLSAFRGIDFFSRAPLVINRREEVRIVDGVNQAEVLGRVKGSLAAVYAHQGAFGSARFRAVASRSAVVVTSDGVIATSLSGLPEAGTAYTIVGADGQPKPATVLFTDRFTGLSFLKISASALPVMKQGFAADLEPGEKLLVAWAGENPGEPAAASATAVWPAVERPSLLSVYDMSLPSAPLPLDWQVTDAALGGVVVDRDAQLLGMAVSGPRGRFVLRAEDLKQLLEAFFAGTMADRAAWKGSYQVLGPAQAPLLGLGKPYGILLKSAFGALRENDFIFAVNGQPLPLPNGFQAFVLGLHRGDKATFGILRDGAEKQVEVEL